MLKVRQTHPPLSYSFARPPKPGQVRPRVRRPAARMADLNQLFPQLIELMGDTRQGFLLTIALAPEPLKRRALLTELFTIRFTGVGEYRGLVITTQDFFLAPAIQQHIQEVHRNTIPARKLNSSYQKLPERKLKP